MKTLLKVLLVAGALAPGAVNAQNYPTKQVTIIVPFTPGGSNDTVARYLADSLGKLWKQNVIVENRAGGGSSIGSAYVARSEPDGYKLLLVSSSYATNAATRDDQGFDAVKDLTPASMVSTGQVGIVVGKRLPISNLADLAREAKSQTVLYATAGVGSTQHFSGEIVNVAMGIKMKDVPYPGGAEGLRDLLGGRIDVVVGAVAGLLSTMEAGGKLIATLGKQRSSKAPDVPTMLESGYPKAVTEAYFGIMVRAGTPPAIIAKIDEGIRTVTNTPEGKAFLTKIDSEPTQMRSEEFATYMRKEINDWTDLAKQIGVRQPKP